MGETIGETLPSLPDAGQGTSQHPAGQIFPGEVGVVKSEFSGPRFDPGLSLVQGLRVIGRIGGAALSLASRFVVDQIGEAIREEEEEKKARELLAEAQLARVEELWELVRAPEVEMPVRLRALFEIAKIKLTPEAEGWFEELASEESTV
ncbi:MAG: hypothetical protein HYS86_03275 [Candidatus Chisholmbacteria bacterium]|nr:hypothetical protein [Candidatus Chisholmbacteria bacterium]